MPSIEPGGRARSGGASFPLVTVTSQVTIATHAQVRVDDGLITYIGRVVAATREDESLQLAAGPRASRDRDAGVCSWDDLGNFSCRVVLGRRSE